MDPEVFVWMHLQFPNAGYRLITELWVVVERKLEFAISTWAKVSQTTKWAMHKFVCALKYWDIELEVVGKCMARVHAECDFSLLTFRDQDYWKCVLSLILFAEADL